MAAWRLFRHRNADGSFKDWAVTSHPDGTMSTRWGKTAARLPGFSTRSGVRQADIERAKQAKGYVFVAEVDIDNHGTVLFTGAGANEPEPLKPIPPMPMPMPMPMPVTALYWHIDCRAKRATRKALAVEVRRLSAVMQSLPETEARSAQDWSGWQALLDLTQQAERFEHSGQIKAVQGVLPWLLLLALKHRGFVGVEIGIATESRREVSTDLKAETEVLTFFDTDLDSTRPMAESLGLLKPRLNLAAVLPDTNDCWF